MNVTLKTKYLPLGDYQLRAVGHYADGGLALELYQGGEKQMRCTVCLSGIKPSAGHILVKDWSENEGLLKALTDAGVIDPVPSRVLRSHFVDVFEVRLTEKALSGLGVLA